MSEDHVRLDLARYRRFSGDRRKSVVGLRALTSSGLRVGLKRRMALFFIYFIPWSWAIVFSFNVYLKYAAESGSEVSMPWGMRRTFLRMVGGAIEVPEQLDAFFNISRFFAVVAIAWYGAGLLAEDRRLNAHLLYFSRPLRPLTYLCARFLTVVFFGLLGTLLPGLLIVATAAFNSPDWKFVREDSGLIIATVAYSLLVTVSLSLLVLAVSSISRRRSVALSLVFVALFVPDGLARMLQALSGDQEFRLISIVTSLRRIGWALLDRNPYFQWPVSWSLAYIGGLAAVCTLVLLVRVRKWERAL